MIYPKTVSERLKVDMRVSGELFAAMRQVKEERGALSLAGRYDYFRSVALAGWCGCLMALPSPSVFRDILRTMERAKEPLSEVLRAVREPRKEELRKMNLSLMEGESRRVGELLRIPNN